jgi:hypothetical protein
VVSLFSEHETATPLNELEHGNQKQRRKVYHTDVTHRAAVYELGGEGCFITCHWNQQRIRTGVFLVRHIEFDEGQELVTKAMFLPAIHLLSPTNFILPI